MDVKDLDSLECPVCQTCLDFMRKFLISVDPHDRRKFIKFLSGSIDTYVKYINFVDLFKRTSKTFKTLTTIHMWAFNNRKKYKALYYKIVDGDNDELGIVTGQQSFNPDEYFIR